MTCWNSAQWVPPPGRTGKITPWARLCLGFHITFEKISESIFCKILIKHNFHGMLKMYSNECHTLNRCCSDDGKTTESRHLWHTCAIPAVGLQDQGQPGLHSRTASGHKYTHRQPQWLACGFTSPSCPSELQSVWEAFLPSQAFLDCSLSIGTGSCCLHGLLL